MKLAASIRPSETRAIEATGGSYEEALEALKGQVPEGWDMLSIITVER